VISHRLLPEDRSAVLLTVGARLRVDAWTAEVVTALRVAKVEAVLLKGPVIGRWLYAEEPRKRTYHDVDLLIAPRDRASAERVLRELGFSEPVVDLPGEWPLHARSWLRGADGAVVDLHRCLHGTEAVPTERVWRMITAHLESQTVANVVVSVPDEVVRTLHVALHIDAKDAPTSTPRRDLERAATQVSEATWQQAVALARELGIEAEMGARLRSVPGTIPLAESLGLPSSGAPRFELRVAARSAGVDPSVYAVARFQDLRGRERRRFVRQKLLPPVAFMRDWSPIARRGRVGLAAAYVLRVAWCAARLPLALKGWRRTRKRLPAAVVDRSGSA
jgi:hypothetical protein